MSTDKAGRAYWDRIWENDALPGAVDPHARSLNNYVDGEFHRYFRKAFSSVDTRNQRLLEIGCARSAWLPYFNKEFGFEVYGVDYSEIGCQQAAQVLHNEGVEGEIVRANFFSPPEHLLETFDAVASFGVVEHFDDTAACIAAFSRFLKPGGFLVTIIPNLTGTMGLIQKAVNRPALDVHVPLDRVALEEAHKDGGLEVVSCDYLLFGSWAIVNIELWRGKPFFGAAIRLRSWASKAMWAAEKAIPLLRPNRLTSPYVACIARKPCA